MNIWFSQGTGIFLMSSETLTFTVMSPPMGLFTVTVVTQCSSTWPCCSSFGVVGRIIVTVFMAADPSGRAVQGKGLRPTACRNCGFEPCRCLSFVNVVCCQVSASGRSPVQRSPTDCGVSFCVISVPQWWGGPGPSWAVAPMRKKNYLQHHKV
jgi:hypothetical protein